MANRMLDPECYRRARLFVTENARSLEAALCAWRLDGPTDARREAVGRALAPYQNADGGLGRGLEPDFHLRASSVLATTVGLQAATEVGLEVDHPFVRGAAAYLVSAWDRGQARWHAVPESVNDAPHAPWWSVDPATGRCSVEGTWANPSAECTAHLWRYRDLVPGDLLETATSVSLEEFARATEPIDLHDFLCWSRLAQVMPSGRSAPMVRRLAQAVTATADTDPATWDAYGAKPLTLAPTPDSPFAPALKRAIETNLDFEIERQAADGSWRPNWSWAEQDPEAWSRAERDWAGVLTVSTLASLKAYGRLA